MKAQLQHRMRAAVIGIVAAIASAAAPASAQRVVVTLPLPLPPAVVVAQVPVYFEGRPVYFYQSRWYYRDPRGTWTYYRVEPPYLHQHRMQHPPRWHYYAGGRPHHGGGRHR